MRLVLIDDHVMFREVLAESLTRRGLDVVGQAPNADAGLCVVEAERPDVVVMDLVLAGASGLISGPNGIGATRGLRRATPTAAVLMLSGFSDPAYVSLAFRAGARGYALKTQTADELVGALRQIQGGGRYLSPGLTSEVDLEAPGEGASGEADPLDLLSSREREIFDLVVSGRTNKEIASRLFISVKTVETHRSRINRKVNAHSTGDLMLLASRRGLLI
jgi:two-component system response regulator NreC